MSENDKSVRRVGRQDRKEHIEPVSSLFPEGEAESPSETPDSAPTDETPDFLALLPDENPDEGLDLLANLPPRVLRPNAITPAEERFPPTAPPRTAPKARPAPKQPASPPAKPRRRGLYNLITLLAILGIFAAVGFFAVLWVDPYSSLNPFPRATPFVYVTSTPGSALLAPTFVETSPPVPLVIDSAGYQFLVPDAILYAPNGNGLGCAWGSIAGSVTASDGSPLNGYRVRVMGSDLDEVTFSGAAGTFGPGGYEMPLGSVPQTQEYTVQLFSPQDAPLSPAYPVTTQASCEQNVTVVNFRETP